MSIVISRIIVNESVVSADLDDETVLLNVETGFYFGLDVVGSKIWSLLSQGMDEDGVFENLLQKYDVEPDLLRSELTAFLQLLNEKGLIRFEG